MLIVGAKGFAKEVLEILYQRGQLQGLAFYDDVSNNVPALLYNKFPVLRNEHQVEKHFAEFGNQFTIGIGQPRLRRKMFEKFTNLHGLFTSTVSLNAEIGNYGVDIGPGCNVLGGVQISNSTRIGKGCIIYYNSIITHDVTVGDFTELSPGVTLLGAVKVGENVQVGAGAIILPGVTIGNSSIIGAGAVVRSNISDGEVAVGVPAKTIKKNV